MNALASLQVDALLSYAIAIVLPALDAILPVLPSETAIITLGVATAGSTDPRIGLLVAFTAAEHRAPVLPGREGSQAAGLGRAFAGTVRDAAHRGLPVHPRRADGGHAVLRHRAL